MIGQTLGNYRIVEQIGMGGMATVYKAYDPNMDRYVAVKILPQHYAQDTRFLKRFEREAKAIAKLEHPHILPVHAYGEEGGITYMVMRYLPYGTLKERIDQGPLPFDQASLLLGQVAGALDYAHANGVLHRDVKPSNILIDSQGNAFLTDFGIAKMVEVSIDLTMGGILGTPAYMSPEQCRGSEQLTPACDQYALGIVLYEMVTGRTPFRAETPLALINMQINSPLPPPRTIRPDLPEGVERVILKALSKEPDQRFPSCRQMAAQLTSILSELPQAVVARPATAASVHEPIRVPTSPDALTRDDGLAVGEPRPAPRRMRPWQVWAYSILALLIVAGVVGGAVMTGSQGEAESSVSPQAGTQPATPRRVVTREPTPAVTISPAIEQARAFAQPILDAIAGRAPDYVEDFSDPNSGWPAGPGPQGGETGYVDGEYYFRVPYLPPEQCCLDAMDSPPTMFADFVMEFDARYVSGERGGWNMTFRRFGSTIDNPIDAWYEFVADPWGNYTLSKTVNYNPTILVTGDDAPPFHDGFATNHITIIASGPHIAIYVNDEPLLYVVDDAASRGTFVPSVSSATETSIEVRFDNIHVWDISNLVLP